MTTSSDLPKICLNMIVKNESRVIMRLLESVSSYIDYYRICDTGSTDDTITIIREFFESRGIPGAIYEEPFRDFGYNRTFALEKCHTDAITNAADYILLLDADMQLNIKVPPTISGIILQKPAVVHIVYSRVRPRFSIKTSAYWRIVPDIPIGVSHTNI